MVGGSSFESYSTTLRRYAADRGNELAVVAVSTGAEEHRLTWAALDEASRRAARVFSDRGVTRSSTVAVALPNGLDHVVSCGAAWILGACVLPLSPDAPPAERDQHLALARPDLVVAEWQDVPGVLAPARFSEDPRSCVDDLPDLTADPGKAIGTGGSTGRPKLIVQPGPWGRDPDSMKVLAGFGFEPDVVQLVAGPLHHNFGFDWCYHGLMHGHTVVLMERFDASLAVALIERHSVEYAGLVPTMMRRIAQLPGIDRAHLTALRTVLHSAGPCPEWVKLAWIELIGAEGVIEGYGASEGFGNTVIRGDEWLEHRGSVGRPYHCELKILDDDGVEAPTGAVGEVWMRRAGVGDRYVGEQRARVRPDGFGSVGDLGHVDAEGYLYLADRRTDLIISGGVNVYPAEVENALSSHPAICDVAVIGLPDDEWGRVVHAVVAINPGVSAPSVEELTAHCRVLLAPSKLPRSYEFLDALPRDDGGKLRRAALLAERVVVGRV